LIKNKVIYQAERFENTLNFLSEESLLEAGQSLQTVFSSSGLRLDY